MNSSLRVKRLMHDMSISDQTFLSSRFFADYLRHLLFIPCKRYGIKIPRVTVVFDSDPLRRARRKGGAYTDGDSIVIYGDGYGMDSLNTREKKVCKCIGRLVHEFGHVLFTDFQARKTAMQNLNRGMLWPPLPAEIDSDIDMNAASMLMFLKKTPTRVNQVLEAWADIYNILEDGYIEECDYRTLGGILIDGLTFTRTEQYKSAGKFINLSDEEWAIPETLYVAIHNCLLLYTKYGTCRNELKDRDAPPIQCVMRVHRFVDALLYESDSRKRMLGSHMVFLGLWPEIEAYIMSKPESENISPDIDAKSRGMVTAIPNGTSRGRAVGIDEDTHVSGSKKTREKTVKQADSAYNDMEEGEVKAAEKGETTWVEGYEGAAPNHDELEIALRSIEKDVRKEEAEIEANSELTDELTSECEGLDYGAAHRGMRKKIRRIAVPSQALVDAFDALYDTYKGVVDDMVRMVAPYLSKDKEQEIEMSGFYTGSKFDATRLVYNDWRCFKQDACPIPDKGVALTVLIDLSASMGGDSNRIIMARVAAMVLYMFCNRCGIPCSVIGHTCSFYATELDLEVFADFETPDENDKYRLMNISARQDNRDGAAILYAGEHLLKRPETTKLMVVISDGDPVAKGYCGAAARADMSTIITELRRRGENIFAAAIGSDKDNIHNIYGDGFIDISNINNMPGELLSLVRRYVN